MSRIISSDTQNNLWAKQADLGDASSGLEPQRNDLFYVDLDNAVRLIQQAGTFLELPPIKPQLARSVTFPENKVRPDQVRRDSVAYNMPCWDEPLDAIRIVFLVDTWDADNRSDIVEVLDVWLALVRAGRGARQLGYLTPRGWYTLDKNYRVECSYDVHIHLLRGNSPSGTQAAIAQSVTAQALQIQPQANQTFSILKNISNLTSSGPNNAPSLQSIPPIAPAPPLTTANMVDHTIWILRNAWLSGYKLSDLNYSESGLMQVEATFFADAIERPNVLPFNTQALVPDESTLQTPPGSISGIGSNLV